MFDIHHVEKRVCEHIISWSFNLQPIYVCCVLQGSCELQPNKAIQAKCYTTALVPQMLPAWVDVTVRDNVHPAGHHHIPAVGHRLRLHFTRAPQEHSNRHLGAAGIGHHSSAAERERHIQCLLEHKPSTSTMRLWVSYQEENLIRVEAGWARKSAAALNESGSWWPMQHLTLEFRWRMVSLMFGWYVWWTHFI